MDIGRRRIDSSAETFLTFLYLKFEVYCVYYYLGYFLLLQNRNEKNPPPDAFFSFGFFTTFRLLEPDPQLF